MSAKKTKKDSGLPGVHKSSNPVYLGEESLENYVAENTIMKESIETILTILRNEHYNETSSPFTLEIALNLDQYEYKLTAGKTVRDNTVDFVVCLGKNILMLVEAKLDVKNVDNIRNIMDKISHSKVLLNAQTTSFSCYRDVIVLLANKNFEQNSNRLRRMLISKSKDIKPLTVTGFYNQFFAGGKK